MSLLSNSILILLLLSIPLILLYRKIAENKDTFEPVQQRYSAFTRKNKVNNYINHVKKEPVDFQKMLVQEGLILSIVLFLMFILATKAVFFSAVASGSMVPTFNREDLVLMQNIDRTYKPGDIIMFERPDTSHPVSHRVKSITDNGMIQTAGDATGPDYWELKKEDILGKAVLLQGNPIVIKKYGKFFLIDDRHQDFGPFGNDYQKYVLFFQVIKTYGYVIAAISLLLYIVLTVRQKPWQSK